MFTLQKLGRVVHRLRQEYIPKAKARRFRLGVSSFALREFSSLNAAGRMLGVNRWTGENRIRRTVHDTGLAGCLERLLAIECFAGRSGYFFCSLDHSQFGPFCIAVLAVSVRKGRAIPIWAQVNHSEAALMVPLLTALEELLATLRQIAPRLKLVLVMDRWFATDKLFKLLTAYRTYFTARTKSDKKVQLPWDPGWWKEPIGDISHEELTVAYRKHRLRLVRSDYTDGIKGSEPWFLLTNLPEPSKKGAADGATRRQVLNRYKERFEIEEAFKDMKWLQRLEWQQAKKPETIRTLLLFAFLGWWLLWRYLAKDQPSQRHIHPKKRLSWFRQSWEQLQSLLQAQHWLLT